MLRLGSSLSRLRLAAAACRHRPLSSVAPRGGSSPGQSRGGGGAAYSEEQFDKDEEETQEKFLQRFDGPVPVLRKPLEPPTDAVLETWAPQHLVSTQWQHNVVNFRTQYFHSSADWEPPESAKVVLRVKPSRLGLDRDERRRLAAVCGPVRYNRATGVLKLTSMTHTDPHLNKAELRQILAAVVADARENARAFAAAEDATKPLAARADPWLRRRKSTDKRMVARPPRPLVNDWRVLVQKPPARTR
eukprot:scaffold32845_cov103-Isochrysis_galbana.AAC.2